MSSLTQLNWFVLIGVFAATVLVHALLTLALSRAKERWDRGEQSQRLLSIVGKSSGRAAAGPASDTPLVSQSSPTV